MIQYAVVVATRNRLDMLRVSLPTFVQQSTAPARVVVVDRSDNHDEVRDYCEAFSANLSMPFTFVYGRMANLPAQRNQGLDEVAEDVTIFPDDDVLWYPDTGQKFVEVYEADVNCRYGAVSGSDVYVAPGRTAAAAPRRRSRFTDRAAVMKARNRLEAAMIPQPFEVYGLAQTDRLRHLALMDGLTHPLVATIGGYRMSFRTETAKALRFDETLGSRIGYAVHEDKDMGLRVLKSGQLVGVADQARVFHNVHPSKRAGGFKYGFFHIFNYMYVCRKVFPQDSRAAFVTKRYLNYKVALYSLRFNDHYTREIYRGARVALSEFRTLEMSDADGLFHRYAEVCDRHGF